MKIAQVDSVLQTLGVGKPTPDQIKKSQHQKITQGELLDEWSVEAYGQVLKELNPGMLTKIRHNVDGSFRSFIVVMPGAKDIWESEATMKHAYIDGAHMRRNSDEVLPSKVEGNDTFVAL